MGLFRDTLRHRQNTGSPTFKHVLCFERVTPVAIPIRITGHLELFGSAQPKQRSKGGHVTRPPSHVTPILSADWLDTGLP